VTARRIAQPPKVTPAFARAGSLSRGSDPASYPAKPLVSFRTYRQLSGWNPPPLMIRALRAHCQELTLLATRHRLYILRTIRVEPARSIDFLWCHPARDIAHL